MDLAILYQDEYLVAINKPHGLLVHASPIARNADEFAVQLLRDQIGKKVFPCHRLDRKTAGVLLFAFDKEINAAMQHQFAAQQTEKTYHAIVRGYIDKMGEIDYALTNDKGKTQEAQTSYKRLATAEINLPHGKFETSRYSYVELKPSTGRFHQLRKHMAHIRHPILGDRPHGCNKQNKLWKEKYKMTTMMLHASSLSFRHPISKEIINIEAPFQEQYLNVKNIMRFCNE